MAKLDFDPWAETEIKKSPTAKLDFDPFQFKGGVEQPKELPTRGVISDVLVNILGGTVVDLPETGARALRTLDPEGGIDIVRDLATKVIDWTTTAPEKYPILGMSREAQESYIRRSLTGGFRALPVSLGAGAPGAVAGALLGAPTGPGAIAAGIAGFAGSAGTVFGLAEYDRFVEEAQAQGVPKEIYGSAAVKSAIVEGGLEGAANLLMLMTAGMGRVVAQPVKRTISEMMKTPLKQTLKKFGKIGAIETTTEMTQEALMSGIRRDIGMEALPPMEAAKEAFGPALVMSMLFGLGAQGFSSSRKRNIQRSLVDENTPKAERLIAAKAIGTGLAGQDPAMARQWLSDAGKAIALGQPIDLGADITTPAVEAEIPSPVEPVVAIEPKAEVEAVTEPVQLSKEQIRQEGEGKLFRSVEVDPKALKEGKGFPDHFATTSEADAMRIAVEQTKATNKKHIVVELDTSQALKGTELTDARVSPTGEAYWIGTEKKMPEDSVKRIIMPDGTKLTKDEYLKTIKKPAKEITTKEKVLNTLSALIPSKTSMGHPARKALIAKKLKTTPQKVEAAAKRITTRKMPISDFERSLIRFVSEGKHLERVEDVEAKKAVGIPVKEGKLTVAERVAKLRKAGLPEAADKLQAKTGEIADWVISQGGINMEKERLKGELRDLRSKINKGKKIGKGNRVVRKSTGLTLDQLALRAKDEGLIAEATPDALLEALEGKRLTPTVAEEKAVADIERKTGKNTIKIDPNDYSEGDKFKIQNPKTGELQTYTHRGFDEKTGDILIVNDVRHSLDIGDDIYVAEIIAKEKEAFELTPQQEAKERKAKPVEQDMFGAKVDITGKIPTKEIPETPLEKAKAEEQARKIAKEEKERQEKLPTTPKPGTTLSFMGTQQIYEDLKKLSAKTPEALNKLTDLGKSVFAEGHVRFVNFRTRMKEVLGDIYESFKTQILKVYYRAKKFNEELGEKGFLRISRREEQAIAPTRIYTPAEKSVKAKIGPVIVGKTFKEKVLEVRKNIGAKLRQGIIDQYYSLKKYSERGYMLATLTPSYTGAVEGMFANSIKLDKTGVITIDKQGDGLIQALAPLQGEMDDFLGWIAGWRAEGLKAEGREKLFSDAEIETLKGLNKGTMKDGKSRKVVYDAVLKDFNKINKSVLNIAEKTGLINKEERAIWESDFYVPFYRFIEEKGEAQGPKTLQGLTDQTAFKELKGADIPLNDLLSNVLMNWNHLLSSSLKNQAATVSIDAMVELKGAKRIAEAAKSRDAVYIRKNGNKVWYEIEDPMALEALSALHQEGFNSRAMKAMRAFKRVFTVAVTASPEFRVANLLRDTVTSVAVGKLRYNIVGNVIGGFGATRKDSLTKATMLVGGGEMHFGHVEGIDPEAAKLRIAKGLKDNTIVTTVEGKKRYLNEVGKLWTRWQEFGSRLENVNRAALFEATIKRKEGLLKANYDARDLLNFSRHGAYPAVRFLVQTVPFLNARIQGLDKLGRAWGDEKQRKQFKVVTGAVALASMVLYLAYKDDEDFKNREDWDRDTYFWFKLPGSDIAFRLPKSFEVGAIGTMAERILEQIVDDKVHGELFAERLWFMLRQTFAFDAIPQMARPVLNVYANQNPFTDRPIESLGMLRLSPTERKRAWTSDTTILLSKGMDKVLWDEAVLSPVQIESLVRGYLGWIGATALGAIDQVFSRPITDAPVRPALRIQEYFAVGRFIRQSPARNTRYTTLFYEQLKAMNQTYADIRNYRAMDDKDKALALAIKSKDKLRWRKLYSNTQKELSVINQRIKLIHLSRKMGKKEKTVKILRLTTMKNRLTKMTVERNM